MKLNSLLVGGIYNCFLPVDKPEVCDYWLDKIPVDILEALESDQSVLDFISSRPQYLASFSPLTNIGFEPADEEQGAIVYEGQSRLIGLGSPRCSAVDDVTRIQFRDSDPLKLWGLAMFGHIEDCDEKTPWSYWSAWLVRRLDKGGCSLGEISIDLNEPIPQEVFFSTSPLRAGSLDLVVDIGLANHLDGIFFGDLNNIQDLAQFWNVRALGGNVSFYDSRYETRLNSLLKQWATRGAAKFLPRSVSIVTNSNQLSAEEQAKFPFDVNLVALSGHTLPPASPVYFEEDFLRLAHVSSATSKSLTATIQLPVCKQLLEVSTNDFSDIWEEDLICISVSPLEDLAAESPCSLFYPTTLKSYDFLARHFDNECVRPQRGGFTLVTTCFKRVVRFRLFNKVESARSLLSSLEIKSKNSDAGIRCQQVLRHIGSLMDCRVFKIPGVRALVQASNVTKSVERSVALSKIANPDSMDVSANLQNFRNLNWSSSHSSSPSATILLDYLVSKCVFMPGQDLICEECQLGFWLSIDDLKSNVACRFCGAIINASRQLDKWKLCKSGIFEKENQDGGAIPVVLTADALLNMLPKSRRNILLFGAELKSKIHSFEPCESDFVILSSGPDVLELVVGECKNNGAIQPDDLKKLGAVAEQITQAGCEAFVTLAKLSYFTVEEIVAIRDAAADKLVRFILLDRDDLQSSSLMLTDCEPYRSLNQLSIQTLKRQVDRLPELGEANP